MPAFQVILYRLYCLTVLDATIRVDVNELILNHHWPPQKLYVWLMESIIRINQIGVFIFAG